VTERDPYTGHKTTGHEWNGITELNTAVPWPVWAFLIATVLFAISYWILMPSWPLGTTYSKGVLGENVRHTVATQVREAAARRSLWADDISEDNLNQVLSDKALMKRVRETGHALFGDNCAACHGRDAQGGPGFPSLRDQAWLWGGDVNTVFETIRVGVNSQHSDSRSSQMPAWGRDGILGRQEILDVVAYVQSLSGSASSDPNAKAHQIAGTEVFVTNCATCHGENAQGNPDLGAPNLTDAFWLYGGDTQSLFTTVYDGRQGHMPTWEKRLSKTDREILALYVVDLGRRHE